MRRQVSKSPWVRLQVFDEPLNKIIQLMSDAWQNNNLLNLEKSNNNTMRAHATLFNLENYFTFQMWENKYQLQFVHIQMF